MSTLAEVIDTLTKEGRLYETLEDGKVRCLACAHRCVIKPGRRGICQVRFNREGKLFVPWGYVAGLQVDPIEKKPFYHVLPGSEALSFGMLGCNFHCPYCQNWFTSQALREPAAESAWQAIRRVTPEELVALAVRTGTPVIASTYNEPLITTEWAIDIFRLAQEQGIRGVYVSDGYATPEVLDALQPYLAAMKIDLKTMQDKQYRRLGGVLQRVLDTIRMVHERGIWLEVVTLVVPGFNDSRAELMDMARYLASISPDIPWHVTAFHPDYKMDTTPPTSAQKLIEAAEIGYEAGLHYVYAGNLPGRVDEYEHTYCPHCRRPLIKRRGFAVQEYHLTPEGTCPYCGTPIAGVWPSDPAQVRTHDPGFPRVVW